MKKQTFYWILFLFVISCTTSDDNEIDQRREALLQLSEFAGNGLEWTYPEILKDTIISDTLILDIQVDALPTDKKDIPEIINEAHLPNFKKEYNYLKFNFFIRCHKEKDLPFSYMYSLPNVKNNPEFKSLDTDPNKREKLTIKTLRDHQYQFSGSITQFKANQDIPVNQQCVSLQYDESLEIYNIKIGNDKVIALKKDEFINIMTSEQSFGDTSKLAFAFSNIINLRSIQIYRGIKYAFKDTKFYSLEPNNYNIEKTATSDGYLGFISISEADNIAYCSTSMEGINIKYFIDFDSGTLKGMQMVTSDQNGEVYERIVLIRGE